VAATSARHEREARDRSEAECQMARRAARAELVQRQARRFDSELAHLLRDIVWQRKRDGLRGPRRRVGERLP